MIHFGWVVFTLAAFAIACFYYAEKNDDSRLGASGVIFLIIGAICAIILLLGWLPSINNLDYQDFAIIRTEDNIEKFYPVKTGEQYIFKSSDGFKIAYKNSEGKTEDVPIDLNLTTAQAIAENEAASIEINHKKFYYRLEFLCFYGFTTSVKQKHFTIKVPESELDDLIRLTKQ